MGRGLSELQRKVLALATVNRAERKPPENPWRIYFEIPAPEEAFRLRAQAADELVSRIKEPVIWYFREPPTADALGHEGDMIPGGWVTNAIAKSGMAEASARFERESWIAMRSFVERLRPIGFQTPWISISKHLTQQNREVGSPWVWRIGYESYSSRDEMQTALKPLLAVADIAEAVRVSEDSKGPRDLPDILYSEAMADACGMRPFLCHGVGHRRLPEGQIFDRRAAGVSNYNSANASLSRAIARLKACKLLFTKTVKRFCDKESIAIDLTGTGVATGNKILQDTPEILDDAPLYRNAWAAPSKVIVEAATPGEAVTSTPRRVPPGEMKDAG